jgi:hypothetical protein
MAKKVFRGVVHGRTIALEEEPGVADGERVEVTMKTLAARTVWGEGLQRCAGALADEWTDEDDRILEEIHKDRARDTRRDISL